MENCALTEKDIDRNTNYIVVIIFILLIIFLASPVAEHFNHEKMHQNSADIAKYETIITISEDELKERGYTLQEAYDALIKCGGYKTLKIKNNDIIIIVDVDNEKYWDKQIEKILHIDRSTINYVNT